MISITDTTTQTNADAPIMNKKIVAKLYDWRIGLAIFVLAFMVRLVYMLQVRKCILFMHPTVDAYAYFGTKPKVVH